MSRPTVVLYEDRPRDLVGLQLAVASLLRHSPGHPVRVSAPGAPRELVRWLEGQPSVTVVDSDDLAGSGWNIKPQVLRRALREGHDGVCWLDSDMLVTGDLGAALATRSPGALLVTDDFWYARERGSLSRTLAWGLPTGRVPGCSVNTGLVRVTSGHLPLLDAWQELLEDPRYLAAQARPYGERPLHLLGDQEVLAAMLGSRDHAGLALDWLRRGRDVAQCFASAGFSPAERLGAWSPWAPGRRPLLVHAMGPKPWAVLRDPAADPRERRHMRLSPYTALAAGYVEQLGGQSGAALDWATAQPHGTLERVALRLDPALRELPLAVPEAAVWQARRWAGRARRAVRPAA